MEEPGGSIKTGADFIFFQDDCRDLCDNHEGAWTAGTFESKVNLEKKIKILCIYLSTHKK